MAEVTAKLIKELRNRTGIGMGKCKEALTEAKGDIELAISNLRKAGMATAVKKEGREANEGVVVMAQSDVSIALVEVNAETDFVVKNERFREFADNLAQEIAATQPANLEDFLKQPYSKDSNLTIDEYRATIIQTLGENIQIRRLELFPRKANATLGFYSHGGGKLVALVEVAGSADAQTLAKDLAMHVASEAPEYLSPEEVPERVVAHEKEIAGSQIKGKPPEIMEKILEGKLRAYFDQACLMKQKFIKDPDVTIEKLVQQEGKGALKVTQFLRWSVGG